VPATHAQVSRLFCEVNRIAEMIRADGMPVDDVPATGTIDAKLYEAAVGAAGYAVCTCAMNVLRRMNKHPAFTKIWDEVNAFADDPSSAALDKIIVDVTTMIAAACQLAKVKDPCGYHVYLEGVDPIDTDLQNNNFPVKLPPPPAPPPRDHARSGSVAFGAALSVTAIGLSCGLVGAAIAAVGEPETAHHHQHMIYGAQTTPLREAKRKTRRAHKGRGR
jgi:hypothetical protein